mgnify:CR=1 FL=1
MSKAIRQMLGQPGRVGVAQGEAVRDLISDEACRPPLEHLGAGLVALTPGTGALVVAKPRTSNSRTARCGPACRVVWEGGASWLPPIPIATPGVKRQKYRKP